MTGPEGPDSPLWRFLSERRAFERHPLVLPVSLHGPHGAFAAETVDVSASGVLLRLPATEELEGPDPETACLSPLARLERIFGAAFQVRFADAHLAARARLVRVVRPPDDPDAILVGCQFSLNLHARQLERLGLHPAECTCGHRLHETPTSILPLETDQAAPVEVEVHEAEDREREPLCAGRLVGLGGLVLAAQVEADVPRRVTSRMDGRSLGVRVTHEDEELWAVRAKLLAVRLLPATEPAAEVALLADSAPGPDVTSRFRPRRAAPP